MNQSIEDGVRGTLPASAPAWREHGGGLDVAAARYRRPREEWLDLSTGINLDPYPLPNLAPDLWHRLPGADLDGALRRAAADAYRVADPAWVVPGPGSQALIQWLPRLIAPTAVAVLGPTYNEHAPAWQAAGHRVVEITELRAVPQAAEVLVVVNPNNPTGRRVAPKRLMALAGTRLLVVDEAFADVAAEISLAPLVGADNLVVLRSFGKFFGLAGLRIGFALTGGGLADALRRALGPWALSGPAAAIGAAALADRAWIEATRGRLAAAARRLDAIAAAAGLRLVGGTDLFRLYRHPQAPRISEDLARAGILTRRFAAEPSWLRLGVPSRDADFHRLQVALAGARPLGRE